MTQMDLVDTQTREGEGTTSDVARLHSRIEVLTHLGLPRDRILGQLLQTGFDPALLKARFPEFPESAFVAPPRPQRAAHKPRELAPPHIRATPASTLRAPQVPRQLAAAAGGLATTKSPAETQTAEASATAIDGVSFHYVG